MCKFRRTCFRGWKIFTNFTELIILVGILCAIIFTVNQWRRLYLSYGYFFFFWSRIILGDKVTWNLLRIVYIELKMVRLVKQNEAVGVWSWGFLQSHFQNEKWRYSVCHYWNSDWLDCYEIILLTLHRDVSGTFLKEVLKTLFHFQISFPIFT